MNIIFFLLTVFFHTASADIYRWHDTGGRQHFSDRRHEQAERLEIKPGLGYDRVKAVYDGDTLVLDDGRKVRLLGINTPEVRHKYQSAEAGGEEAKIWLQHKLLGAKVRLVSDAETTDQYGRLLAHVFTENDEHVNLQLVALGLAAVTIHPPNLLYADALIQAQDQAERSRLGIWGQAQYSVVPVDRIPASGLVGWTRVQGRVIDIKRSRKYVYLKFANRFQVSIARRWLTLFPDPGEYVGKTVEVRGWAHKSRYGLIMQILHPSAIRVYGHG